MQGRTKVIGLLAILIIIALIPLLSARYVFNHTSELHIKRRNHGAFVHATRVDSLHVLQAAQSIPLNQYAGRWLLVYDTQGQCCTSQCERGMRQLHQVRIAEHNGIERSVVALLQPAHCARPALAKSDKLWLLNDKQLSAWQQKLPSKQAQVLIIDPNSWVALKYPGDTGPKPVYEDLRVLLHTSQIG
jgi:hypothetical protein